MRNTRWRLARPLLLSAAAHGLFALMIWRAPDLMPTPPAADDVVAIDLHVDPQPEPPRPIPPPEPPPVSPQPARPIPPQPGPSASPEHPRAPRPRPARRAPPPTPAAPSPIAAEPDSSDPSATKRTRFWLRMRSPVETVPLATLPPGPPPPPARDSWGLPVIPLPDVIHHPIGKQVQGSERTATGVKVNVDREGRIAFKNPRIPDLTTLAERIAGNDPFNFEKRRIAEATFEDRLCLAREAELRRQQDGLYHLKERLDRVLQLPNLTAAARREMVFEMWDECLDPTAAAAPDATAASADAPDDITRRPDFGAAARATIVTFIQRVFPPGSPDGYTPTELASLNQRRTSRTPFAPYTRAPAPAAGAR